MTTENKNNADNFKEWIFKIDPKWLILNSFGILAAIVIGFLYYRTINAQLNESNAGIVAKVEAHEQNSSQAAKEDREVKERLVRAMDENTRAVNNLYNLWKVNGTSAR